jgi:hypothetical protein
LIWHRSRMASHRQKQPLLGESGRHQSLRQSFLLSRLCHSAFLRGGSSLGDDGWAVSGPSHQEEIDMSTGWMAELPEPSSCSSITRENASCFIPSQTNCTLDSTSDFPLDFMILHFPDDEGTISAEMEKGWFPEFKVSLIPRNHFYYRIEFNRQRKLSWVSAVRVSDAWAQTVTGAVCIASSDVKTCFHIAVVVSFSIQSIPLACHHRLWFVCRPHNC